MTGLAEAFAYFGAAGRNPRWSWSARSPDGETVVLTIWKDRISDWKQRPLIYDTFGQNIGNWVNRPGNKERIENLMWARDQCDGLFRVVITVAEDESATTRAIKRCCPQPNLVMRILDLNEQTGELRAESVHDTTNGQQSD